MAKEKPNFTPSNQKRSGPQGQTKGGQPSKQFGQGQRQPHTDGRGQSGQPPRR